MEFISCTVRGEASILDDLAALRGRIAGVFDNPTPIQEIVANTVADNMAQECDPDGQPWPKLSESYATWKQGVAPGAPMGVLMGIMSADEQLRGVAIAMGDELVINYGTSAEAIEHAIKFTEGGRVTGTNQPPRPFYGLTREAVRLLDLHFESLVGF